MHEPEYVAGPAGTLGVMGSTEGVKFAGTGGYNPARTEVTTECCLVCADVGGDAGTAGNTDEEDEDSAWDKSAGEEGVGAGGDATGDSSVDGEREAGEPTEGLSVNLKGGKEKEKHQHCVTSGREGKE